MSAATRSLRPGFRPAAGSRSAIASPDARWRWTTRERNRRSASRSSGSWSVTPKRYGPADLRQAFRPPAAAGVGRRRRPPGPQRATRRWPKNPEPRHGQRLSSPTSRSPASRLPVSHSPGSWLASPSAVAESWSSSAVSARGSARARTSLLMRRVAGRWGRAAGRIGWRGCGRGPVVGAWQRLCGAGVWGRSHLVRIFGGPGADG